MNPLFLFVFMTTMPTFRVLIHIYPFDSLFKMVTDHSDSPPVSNITSAKYVRCLPQILAPVSKGTKWDKDVHIFFELILFSDTGYIRQHIIHRLLKFARWYELFKKYSTSSAPNLITKLRKDAKHKKMVEQASKLKIFFTSPLAYVLKPPKIWSPYGFSTTPTATDENTKFAIDVFTLQNTLLGKDTSCEMEEMIKEVTVNSADYNKYTEYFKNSVNTSQGGVKHSLQKAKKFIDRLQCQSFAADHEKHYGGGISPSVFQFIFTFLWNPRAKDELKKISKDDNCAPKKCQCCLDNILRIAVTLAQLSNDVIPKLVDDSLGVTNEGGDGENEGFMKNSSKRHKFKVYTENEFETIISVAVLRFLFTETKNWDPINLLDLASKIGGANELIGDNAIRKMAHLQDCTASCVTSHTTNAFEAKLCLVRTCLLHVFSELKRKNRVEYKLYHDEVVASCYPMLWDLFPVKQTEGNDAGPTSKETAIDALVLLFQKLLTMVAENSTSVPQKLLKCLGIKTQKKNIGKGDGDDDGDDDEEEEDDERLVGCGRVPRFVARRSWAVLRGTTTASLAISLLQEVDVFNPATKRMVMT